jgi:hypothetical protein
MFASCHRVTLAGPDCFTSATTGTGPRIEFADIDASFLEMAGTRVSDQPVAFEHDSTKPNHLHPVAGSEAARVGAGLLGKPVSS